MEIFAKLIQRSIEDGACCEFALLRRACGLVGREVSRYFVARIFEFLS